MNEPLIDNGFASVGAGSWLIGQGQPAAVRDKFSIIGLKGFIVPDRRALAVMNNDGEASLAFSARPFLTHLVSTDSLKVVSSKILVAPLAARKEAKLVRPIPLSLRLSFAVTYFAPGGWVVAATSSRLKRHVLKENEVLCVKCESVVAWTGNNPTAVAGRVRLRDLFIPKCKPVLSLDFYGPQIVWTEGSNGI